MELMLQRVRELMLTKKLQKVTTTHMFPTKELHKIIFFVKRKYKKSFGIEPIDVFI